MFHSKKSERLQDIIVKIEIEVSLVFSSKILSDGVVDIAKEADICYGTAKKYQSVKLDYFQSAHYETTAIL